MPPVAVEAHDDIRQPLHERPIGLFALAQRLLGGAPSPVGADALGDHVHRVNVFIHPLMRLPDRGKADVAQRLPRRVEDGREQQRLRAESL